MISFRFLLALVFSSLNLILPQQAGTTERPNIVFILADDLGYGDLSCYGQKIIKTPNIDVLAAEGMQFTRHYAGSTVCAPSRCVLMTGLHTGHCRVRGNGAALLKPGDITVAEILKAQGYVTGCFGKWGIGHPPPRDNPNQQGFDEFYGYVNMFHAHNFYPEFLIRNGEIEPLQNVTKPFWKTKDTLPGGMKEGMGVAAVKKQYAPDLIVEEAVKFIAHNKGKPFFLYHALNVPHANNEGGRDKESRDGMEVPEYSDSVEADWPNPEKGFASMMSNIDRDVGRIIAALKENGLDEKTLVIFTSDNGPHSEGGHVAEFFDSNGELRGIKRDLFEGGVRVPFIAKWPGKIAAGTSTDYLSGFQDFLPTAAEISGAPQPDTSDGISLLPTLMSRTEDQKQHEFLYWEFSEQGGKQGLVTKRWKALRLNTLKNPDAPIQLYDLEADRSEMTDVADQHPDLVKKFAADLKASRKPITD